MPGHIEGALAIARAAIDAAEFAKARDALSPFIAQPTQRVAMLMAELERTEHGDSGRARAWTMRAVRALHDPAWTADGYVSDRWRPVSPVTGRLDAFQWQTPVAALPSDKAAPSNPPRSRKPCWPRRRSGGSRWQKIRSNCQRSNCQRKEPVVVPLEPVVVKPVEPEPAAQDNAPPAVAAPDQPPSRLWQRLQRPNQPRSPPRRCSAPGRICPRI